MRRTPLLFLVLVLVAACGAGADESRDDLGPANRVLGPVSRTADRAVWTERVGDGPFTRIVAREGATTRELLRPTGSADRAVLSPDGRWVAFVYAPHGIASIGVVPFAGGAPIQLTNVGLERRRHAPGVPPAGFVPVPADDSLRFEGEGDAMRLVWDSPAGPQSVGLPKEGP